jgi:hypothetical protein
MVAQPAGIKRPLRSSGPDRNRRGDQSGALAVFLIAGAAATAAGDRAAARELSARAARLAVEEPTYYGAAWVALGPALLDGTLGPVRL